MVLNSVNVFLNASGSYNNAAYTTGWQNSWNNNWATVGNQQNSLRGQLHQAVDNWFDSSMNFASLQNSNGKFFGNSGSYGNAWQCQPAYNTANSFQNAYCTGNSDNWMSNNNTPFFNNPLNMLAGMNTMQQMFNQFINGFTLGIPLKSTGLEQVNSRSQFSTFSNLLDQSGLAGQQLDELEEAGGVTYLVPTDEAFAALQASSPTLYAQLQNPENMTQLKQILQYHISSSSFDYAGSSAFDSLGTSNDQISITGNAFSGQLYNGSQYVNTGIARTSSNGSTVIPIDQILIPPGFNLSSLV